jgi:2,3-bisphosphoglycerate-independent phosphoglycerate mutase
MSIIPNTNLSESDYIIPNGQIVFLLIDGWGVAQGRDNNAIRLAKIPNFKKLVSNYPATVLRSFDLSDSALYKTIGELDNSKTLNGVLAQNKIKQLRLAETEKFALLTNFFNQSEEVSPLSEHRLIPSVGVSDPNDYKMATDLVVKNLLKEIKHKKFNFIMTSLANIESVSHGGDFNKTIKMIEYIDKVIGQIFRAVMAAGGTLIISAANGFSEEVFDLQTETLTKHKSDNPVPFIIAGEKYFGKTIGDEISGSDLSLVKPEADLSNIAPTIMKMFDLDLNAHEENKSLI